MFKVLYVFKVKLPRTFVDVEKKAFGRPLEIGCVLACFVVCLMLKLFGDVPDT